MLKVTRFFNRIGLVLMGFFNEIGALIVLWRTVVAQVFTGKLHWRNFKEQIVHLGYDSLPIVLITAFFIGMVFAMQITKEFLKYGAGRAVGGVISIAIWRELAPVLAAVIVAGRVGSAIAAELGSMKVTEQVDAVTSFGVDPDYYLVTPKVAALTFMLPVLVALFDIIAILGSYFMSVQVMGLNPMLFYTSVNEMATLGDLAGGLFKATIFGLCIALISCRQGLSTEGGALGVGIATMKSVVMSLLAVFILNYFLSALIF